MIEIASTENSEKKIRISNDFQPTTLLGCLNHWAGTQIFSSEFQLMLFLSFKISYDRVFVARAQMGHLTINHS